MPSTHHRLVAAAVAALVTISLCACGSSNNSDPHGKQGRQTQAQRDLAMLQGWWEQVPEEPGAGSPRQRVVKQVKGNSETVITYDAQGRAVYSQTADFRLSRDKGVPMYTYSAARVTASAGDEEEKAKKVQGPRSYLYKVRPANFYEVWGLLPGQEEREIVVRHWKRTGPGGS